MRFHAEVNSKAIPILN